MPSLEFSSLLAYIRKVRLKFDSGGGVPARLLKRAPRIPIVKTWEVQLPDSGLMRDIRHVRVEMVQARTKSEARAAVKRIMGIGRKGRLPIGTVSTLLAARRAA